MNHAQFCLQALCFESCFKSWKFTYRRRAEGRDLAVGQRATVQPHFGSRLVSALLSLALRGTTNSFKFSGNYRVCTRVNTPEAPPMFRTNVTYTTRSLFKKSALIDDLSLGSFEMAQRQHLLFTEASVLSSYVRDVWVDHIRETWAKRLDEPKES